MDTVRPANHFRVTVLERALADDLAQGVEISENQIARFAHLQRLRGIDGV